jgi:hypothetical protein
MILKYLEKKVALAINSILNDFECLTIVNMKIHSIFNL